MQTITLNSHQQEIADAFWADHSTQLSFEIKVVSSRPANLEGYTIEATRNGSTVSATIGIALDHSIRYALNHLLRWSQGSDKELKVEDGPDFPIRGVVEGFYGKPWSHEQRIRGLKNFGDFNMNTYFLAPKDVPWQRFNWRQPFDTEFLTKTAELTEIGRKNAIDIVTCVSPGLSVKYCDEGDVDAVLTRYKQLFELGARHFGMLWDDIAWELQHQEDIDNELYHLLDTHLVSTVGEKMSADQESIEQRVSALLQQGADPFNRVVLRTNGLESDPNTLSYDLLAFDRAKRSRAGNLSVCIAHFGAFDFLDDDCLNDRWTDVIGITAPIVGSLNLPHINQHIRRLCHLHRDTCANHRETAGK